MDVSLARKIIYLGSHMSFLIQLKEKEEHHLHKSPTGSDTDTNIVDYLHLTTIKKSSINQSTNQLL